MNARHAIGRRNFLKAGAAATAASILIPHHASYAAKLPTASVFPSNVPRLPGPPISIDVHAHWAADVYLKAKADLGRRDFINPTNNSLVARVKWMDDHSAKLQVLPLGGFMPWQWVTPEQGVHIAQITNDASIEAHKAFPGRFLFGVELPVGYAAGALAELNRVGDKPGLVAVHVPNSLSEREYLFEPAFAPVLARIEELGLPLLIHPLDDEPNWYGGHRLHDAYSGNNPNQPDSLIPGLTNSLGENYEQAATVAKLVVSGTMDRYPSLDVIICHGGGAFPYILGRLARDSGTDRLKYPVHSYIRRFHFVNNTWYPPTLRYLIDLVGSDRVVLGSDYMAAAANTQPGALTQTASVAGSHSVIDQLDLAMADRELILRGNLQRLFRL